MSGGIAQQLRLLEACMADPWATTSTADIAAMLVRHPPKPDPHAEVIHYAPNRRQNGRHT